MLGAVAGGGAARLGVEIHHALEAERRECCVVERARGAMSATGMETWSSIATAPRSCLSNAVLLDGGKRS
jgi:hypothetical protein